MSIRKILLEESRRLDEIISRAMEDMKKAPEGNLVAKDRKGKVHFYRHTKAGKAIYLSRTRDHGCIRALAQKAYARKVLRAACRQKAILDRFLADYDPEAVSGVFRDGRRDGLISPYVKEPLEEETFSFRLSPVVDIELVSQLRNICSRILEG